MTIEKELNANVVTAIVEDWIGMELVRFEGRNSSFEAIEWKEREAKKHASKFFEDINSDDWEDCYNGASEDLYIVGYDEQGGKTVVEFG